MKTRQLQILLNYINKDKSWIAVLKLVTLWLLGNTRHIVVNDLEKCKFIGTLYGNLICKDQCRI